MTIRSKPIDTHAPPGWHTVTPRIIARNAEALVEFVKHVFSATAAHDASAPSIVTIGDSRIMISEAGVRDVETQFYPGGRHEMFNETNRDEVIANLIAWLNRITSA